MFVVNPSITNPILPKMCGLKTNDVSGPKSFLSFITKTLFLGETGKEGQR